MNSYIKNLSNLNLQEVTITRTQVVPVYIVYRTAWLKWVYEYTPSDFLATTIADKTKHHEEHYLFLNVDEAIKKCLVLNAPPSKERILKVKEQLVLVSDF